MGRGSRRRTGRVEKPPLAARAAAARQEPGPREVPPAPEQPAASPRHPLIAIVLAEAGDRRAAAGIRADGPVPGGPPDAVEGPVPSP